MCLTIARAFLVESRRDGRLYSVCSLAEVQEHAASSRAGRYRCGSGKYAGLLVVLQFGRVLVGALCIVNEIRRVHMQCVAGVSRRQGSLDSNVNSPPT